MIPEGEGARRNPQHTHKYIQHMTHKYVEHITQKYTLHMTHIYTVHITHKFTLYMTHKYIQHKAQINRTTCKKTEHIAQTH